MVAKKVYRKKRVVYSKAKKMVTGHGPTMLDQIASGVGSVAKLATAVAPAIAAINTEAKYYDQTASVLAHTPGTSDQVINLTQGIAQSLTDSGRIGNSVLAKDLQVRLAYNFNSVIDAANVLGIHCRMSLICWKENIQLNQPTALKLFESPTNLYSAWNKDYTDQFVVMKDKFFSLNNSSGQPGSVAFTAAKIFKKIGWHLRWDGGLTSDGTQNHIYLILRSSSSGSTSALSTTYYSRLNYTDN